MRNIALQICAWALLSWSAAAAESTPTAKITAVHIEKTNVVVDVEVSGALAKVTLESSSRVGRRSWEPRAVEVLTSEKSPSNVTFTVPISPAMEILRVRAELVGNTLPLSFYQGTNTFVAGTGSGGTTGGTGGGSTGATGGTGGGPAVPGVDSSRDQAPTTPARSVVESDIWKVDGDTLFFFNQYRGLQVIDVSHPATPKITGTYDLAAAGEQMYVVDHDKVVLLARDNCGWYGSSADSRVVLLQVTDGVPRLVKELPVPGYIDESRMVGSALYVVSQSYQQRVVPASSGKAEIVEWNWGSEVISFDLSDFAGAKQKSDDWITGYNNVIHASEKYLFVAQLNYDYSNNTSTSVIHCYDVSAPDGTFSKLSVIKVAGTVPDKFKMEANGDVFSVVTQIDWPAPRLTYLNTFSLADPKNPVSLGKLKIVESERLFATRFDGDRLYVVTFFQIDPLWIIDLSNPAAPKKVGELQIPGWSTFLQPLGDKLLAIGLDQTNGTSRTAVQLFDVANPAAPALLSKVLIGEQWSGSEANWDEKAFGVLPEDKLVLVPFYSSGTNGWMQGVQLIDLESDHLVKRGIITQNMAARRATLHLGTILSISSSELLSVDATDRDHPVVLQTTQLAWAADRVNLVGDYVIEVDASGSASPALRVVSANDPSLLLKSVQLTNLPYLGSTVVGQKFYVLQGKPMEVIYPKQYNPTNYFPIATNPAVFLYSELDLSHLPELPVLNSGTQEGSTNYFYGRYEALQVKPELLVWRSKNSGYGWWPGPIYYDAGPVAGGGGILALADSPVGRGIFRPIWWGGGAGHMITLNIGGEKPSFGGELNILTTNSWWNFGDAFTTNGLVYLSHQANEFDLTIDPPPFVTSCYNGTNWVTCTNDPPPGWWVQRYYLDVVDFNDPAEPLVRKPVNIPGSLIGIDRGGDLLLTRGYMVGADFYYSGNEVLTASSYDGVSAHLVAELSLSNSWSHATLANGPYVYVGNPPPTNSASGSFDIWTLGDTGKFQLVTTKSVESAPQQFKRIGNLVAVQANQISIFDATNPADPKPIGGGRSNNCYGVILDGADGDVARGLWVPIGWYGVIRIPVTVR